MKYTNTLISIFVVITVFLSATVVVSAHVVVKPNSVGVATYQTFTMGVPVEKDMPTVALRLVIPSGVTSVTPNVKPGWTITTKGTGTGEGAKITEINWTGGNIPSGQRDEFSFSAQAPATPTTLQWKAYQTYADGSIVSWDQASDTETEDKGPFSKTDVINDVKPVEEKTAQPTESRALLFSLIAVALSATAIGMQLRKK